MTSISAASINTRQSPLQKLQDELLSEVNSGAVSSSDKDALSTALTDIDSAMQASRTSDQASGTRPSPDQLKSKIDDLINGEVSSGKLTSDQATELQGIFKAAFANGPGAGRRVDFFIHVEGPMASDVLTKPHPLVASDRVEGTAVRRPNGDTIGHIERLMIDKVTGKVSYAILSFGGFLGIGANLIPLPWGRLRYNTKFEAYELDIDDEELKRAPSFRADKDFDWGDRAKEAELHRYYGMPPYWGGF